MQLTAVMLESFPLQDTKADVHRCGEGEPVNLETYLRRRLKGEAKSMLPCGIQGDTILTIEETDVCAWN